MILYLISYNDTDIYYNLYTKTYIRFPIFGHHNNFILLDDEWYYSVTDERCVFPETRRCATEKPVCWRTYLEEILLSKILENI